MSTAVEIGVGISGFPWRSGGVLLPSTAAYLNQVPLTIPVANIAPAGVVGDFSFGAWYKIIQSFDQYDTFFVLQKMSNIGESGSYYWFGRDRTAFGGNRGLALFGPGGSHSYPLLPANGTWFHAGATKTGVTCRAYLNGAEVDWDTAVPGTNYSLDIGSASYDDIDRCTICREIDPLDDDRTQMAVRAAFFANERFTQAQMAAIMVRSDPRNAPGVTIDGSWRLTSGTDFADTAGGIGAMTGVAATQGDSPAGITLP